MRKILFLVFVISCIAPVKGSVYVENDSGSQIIKIVYWEVTGIEVLYYDSGAGYQFESEAGYAGYNLNDLHVDLVYPAEYLQVNDIEYTNATPVYVETYVDGEGIYRDIYEIGYRIIFDVMMISEQPI